MKKLNILLLLCIAIFMFFTYSFSANTAYSFFDKSNVNVSAPSLNIGNGFWQSRYIFKDLDPVKFNTTGIWGVDAEGFISNNGNIYINNYREEYEITSIARLSGNTTTHGAYRVYFESTLNQNNLANGYALVFDNINANIKIVRIESGNVAQTLLTFNNSTHAFLPQNASDNAWRQNYEIIIQVSDGVTSGVKHLNVWVNNNQLVSDYVINAISSGSTNITGYFTHPLQTTFIEMNIEDYISNIFTITFDSNGGNNIDSIREQAGTQISAPISPVRQEATFIEWRLNGTQFTFNTMPAENITLVAHWLVNQYTITFNSNGGSTVSPITQEFGSVVTAPTTTKLGHTFDGWYSNIGLTNPYTFSTMPNQNLTVYAKWIINSYTITFNTDGGSAVSPITQNYGTTVVAPTNPLKAGYVFSYWTLNSNPYTFGVVPAENITLVAVYEELQANEYTITFNSNGGSAIASIVQEEGTPISAPTNPTRTGYTFNGWYSDELLTTPYVFNIMPSENITVYAKWTINSYTISFNSNGGSAVSAITQNFGTNVTAPTNPTRSGYLFIEWTLSGATYTFSTMSAENITLVAIWEQIQNYTITFNSNGGSAVSPITQPNGSAVTAPTNPTRTGYTFNGWYNDVALTNLYTFSVMPNMNITLYARWTINSYTITFITNGGSAISPITANYGTTITAPLDPIRTGNFTFAGWYADSQLTTQYTFGAMPAQDTFVFADWASVGLTYQLVNGNSYRVTGNTSESAIIQIPQRYQGLPVVEIGQYAFNNNTYMQIVNIPNNVTTISEDAFVGLVAMQQIYIPINVTTINRLGFRDNPSLTINAQATSRPGGWHNQWNPTNSPVNWGAQNIPSLVFNSNGGSAVSSINQVAGTSITPPTNPTKLGHTFNGWYSDAELINPFVFNLMPAQSTVVYAKWTINSYTITFNTDGGSAVNPITQNYGTTVTAPTSPTKEGFAFSGWTLNSNPYTFGTMPAENITLIATYTELAATEYTISFDSNGGSVVASIVAEEGTPISAPTNPTRSGYTFAGWYSDIALTNAYIFTIMPSENITLYAKWNMITYTITFVTNGGSAISPATYQVGASISPPANPVKTGNIFSGWYSDAKLKNYFTFTTMPDMNITLYADWGTTGLTYQLISGIGYIVNGVQSGIATVQIPQRYLDMPVVEIGAYAFQGNTTLQYINIPYTVITIGDYAFEACSSLQQIYIPINVTTVGDRAFRQCQAATISVQAVSKPAGWHSRWNQAGGTVIWGVADN